MILRGIDFGRVWGASGVQGFFGEGYWFHRWWKPFGLKFDGMTFVAKTTTLDPNEGNMPLKDDFSPRERFPKCVIVKPLKRVVLNAVGLSGPGAKALFETGLWQQRRQPFFLSFASVAGSSEQREAELSRFVSLFKNYLPAFSAPVGLQINYSCPNVGVRAEKLVKEVETGLTIASELKIPLVLKFNLMLSIGAFVYISGHPACDAICLSNTIPWGALADEINWRDLFGTNQSPLAHLGGGGLSGKPLLPLVIRWLRKTRRAGLEKPINAGGGILSKTDAHFVLDTGADSIFLGSVVLLRPWRVKSIVSGINRRKENF